MKLTNIIRSISALGAALTISTSAQANPILFAGTGHFYEHIRATTTWTDARTAALGMTHMGQSGYLVTITSAAENAFLAGLSSEGWIGGTDQAVEGTWRWIDGPEAGEIFWSGGSFPFNGSSPTFASWDLFEPNNSGGNEHVALYSGGTWNDGTNTPHTTGYFVEFNPAQANGQVPEPATLALFGIGLAGLCFARRRRAA